MAEGHEAQEAHEVLKTWTMLAVFLSSIGAVVQNPVARSTRQAKNLCGGSCVHAGSLPEVSAAIMALNSLLPWLITDCSWGTLLFCLGGGSFAVKQAPQLRILVRKSSVMPK